jgi:hypothetical protein
MRKLIVDEWTTLDGVAKAPGEPDEDTTGGFQHGGWHMRYVEDGTLRPMRLVDHEVTSTGAFLATYASDAR